MKQETSLAVVSMLKEHQSEIKALAPKYINPARMMTIFLEAVKNPKLAECTSVSVLASCKKMAELGTERVGAGGVWLVPFAKEMTVMPDWRLMIDKAKKAGVIKHASSTAVFDGEIFEWEKGLNPKLVHKQGKKRGEMTNVYCVYILPDGEKDFEVMSKEEVDKIRKRSKASGSGPWVTDYVEMAKKTVVRRALKIFEGASPELSKVIDADNAAVGFEELNFGEPISEPKALDTEATEVPPEKENPAGNGNIPPKAEESQGEAKKPVKQGERAVEGFCQNPDCKWSKKRGFVGEKSGLCIDCRGR